MLDYLKAAFWIAIPVPGLGRLPVNVLLVAGCAILGFANPGFWLLGTGAEAALLTVLATNPRFQRAVDARRLSAAAGEAELHRQDLVRRLDPVARKRLAAVDDKCARVLQVQQEAQTPEIGLESSRDALSRLSWIYLKLLIARHHLVEALQGQAGDEQRVPRLATAGGAAEVDLKRQLADLDRALAAPGVTTALRDSQQATRKILEQRLQNIDRCQQTLKEVDADLGRIEAQVDLALENANLRGGGAVVSANLELASQILDDGLSFGDSERDVAALDEAYSAPPARVGEQGPGR
ncbi:MAG TPA: hypothetical protein VHG32_26295 [Thermoanaerobaculia bacterium]|jgi:hypothetical protein|nr:hypothetical protein [Thermoanaerobaculia bacterium]